MTLVQYNKVQWMIARVGCQEVEARKWLKKAKWRLSLALSYYRQSMDKNNYSSKNTTQKEKVLHRH